MLYIVMPVVLLVALAAGVYFSLRVDKKISDG